MKETFDSIMLEVIDSPLWVKVLIGIVAFLIAIKMTNIAQYVTIFFIGLSVGAGVAAGIGLVNSDNVNAFLEKLEAVKQDLKDKKAQAQSQVETQAAEEQTTQSQEQEQTQEEG